MVAERNSLSKEFPFISLVVTLFRLASIYVKRALNPGIVFDSGSTKINELTDKKFYEIKNEKRIGDLK